MRGIRVIVPGAIRVLGITPACAGNTCWCGISFPLTWDHPRLCGEYVRVGAKISHSQGSPPPVRGIQATAQTIAGLCGITPACAGNTETMLRLNEEEAIAQDRGIWGL